jgi:hypothetical protein
VLEEEDVTRRCFLARSNVSYIYTHIYLAQNEKVGAFSEAKQKKQVEEDVNT